MAAAAAAILLGVCVALCLLTGTANAARMELAVCIISAAGGCAVIFVYTHFVSGGRRREKHIRSLLDGEESSVTGLVSMDENRVKIPGSVTVRALKVRRDASDEQTAGVPRSATVNVLADKAGLFPPLPARLTLYTVHGYVTAFSTEEDGDEDN